MAERCPRCGMRFEREEGFFLGAYVVNFAVTEGLLSLLPPAEVKGVLAHEFAHIKNRDILVSTIRSLDLRYPKPSRDERRALAEARLRLERE